MGMLSPKLYTGLVGPLDGWWCLSLKFLICWAAILTKKVTVVRQNQCHRLELITMTLISPGLTMMITHRKFIVNSRTQEVQWAERGLITQKRVWINIINWCKCLVGEGRFLGCGRQKVFQSVYDSSESVLRVDHVLVLGLMNWISRSDQLGSDKSSNPWIDQPTNQSFFLISNPSL